MGRYDFFRGMCPHCGRRFDIETNGEIYGEIQTKMFVDPQFRSFFPGNRVPASNYGYGPTEIGQCRQCHGIIVAQFDQVGTKMFLGSYMGGELPQSP